MLPAPSQAFDSRAQIWLEREPIAPTLACQLLLLQADDPGRPHAQLIQSFMRGAGDVAVLRQGNPYAAKLKSALHDVLRMCTPASMGAAAAAGEDGLTLVLR